MGLLPFPGLVLVIFSLSRENSGYWGLGEREEGIDVRNINSTRMWRVPGWKHGLGNSRCLPPPPKPWVTEAAMDSGTCSAQQPKVSPFILPWHPGRLGLPQAERARETAISAQVGEILLPTQ